MFKRFALSAMAAALAACGSHDVRGTAPAVPARTNATALASLPPPGHYRIDARRSEVRVLVYRAGALANLGHNHVMVNRALAGSVEVGSSLADSSFLLELPVAAFRVDEAQARREEGEDFPPDVPDDAKSGTLHNMLSAAVLNAAEFPRITLRSGAFDASSSVTLNIDVAGHESNIVAPFALQSDSLGLVATGSFEVRQSALGMMPYSFMLGALQVRDGVVLRFRILAVPSG